jgi:nitroreductase
MQEDPQEAVLEAIASRRSVRGFLDRPVDRAVVERLLEVARWAPSGSNTQPWKVHALQGSAREALCALLTRAHLDDEPERPDYAYYPRTWRTPYIERRRATGWSLYRALGIERGDREGAKQYRGRNYRFFGAPVGLIVTMDSDMEAGSWIDMGAFVQNILVAARAFGLHTCPQAAFSNYADLVRQQLGLPDTQVVLCGVAIGYPDWDDPANAERAGREAVGSFAQFHWDP